LKTILIVAAVAYGLVVAFMYLAQRALLYPGAYATAPELAAAPWGEWTRIATPDGETLAALYAPAAGGKPTILYFHGNADDIRRYGFLAEMLGRQGYGLLAVSYRGYGGSTGSPTEAGLLTDGLAAYDWLAARGGHPIVLLGQSLGSGVAVNTAAERDAAAIVLISAYDSVLAVARSSYPFLPVAALLKDNFRSDLRIARVGQPKLFLHGDRDGIIPMRFGEALFAAAPEPKRFSIQQDRGHNDLWTTAMVDEVVAFVAAAAAQ
jgi:fermentation-respiration switch protein FrsA (DUF1100 family)